MTVPKLQPVCAARRRSRANRMSRLDNLQMLTMCLPGLACLFCFCYLPMFGLILAFKKYKFNLGFLGSEWCGLDNFKFFFTSGTLGRLLKNTLGLNLLFLLCNTVITILLALLLFEIKNRAAIRWFQTIIFLPFVISWVAASYALYANFSDVSGIVNTVIRFFGGQPVSWYAAPDWWPAILLVCYLWKNMGYGIIIYYGNLLSIDSSYFEAAALDGATRGQMMRHISFPFIRPIVTMFFILSLGKVFSADFGMFYYMTKDSSLLYSATDVIDTYVYRALRVTGDVGMSTAVGLCQSAVGFAVLLIANKIAGKVSEEGTLF